MIDLDTRARSASTALKESVATADLRFVDPPSERVGPSPTGGRSGLWSAVGGALAALVLLFGVWTIRPTVVAEDTAESTTTSTVATTTTVPTTTVPTTAAVVPTTVPPAAPAAPPPTEAADTTPPVITITTPSDGQVFEEKSITFAGTTEPGARVFGGPYEASVDAAGNWSIVLLLSEGSNTATFRAVDAAGNEATASVTAVYESPKPAEPEIAAFKAFQTWGVCDSTPPYEEFYGKGQPGSWVVVQSEWGGGETIVEPSGEWYLKVEFPELPKNKGILVTVKDQFGRSKNFEFRAVEPG